MKLDTNPPINSLVVVTYFVMIIGLLKRYEEPEFMMFSVLMFILVVVDSRVEQLREELRWTKNMTQRNTTNIHDRLRVLEYYINETRFPLPHLDR